MDVRVLLPRKSNVRLVQWAARAVYGNLISKGIRIYEYIPRMLHAKSIIIDDMYSVLGSANMDYRSIFLNYELNLFSANPQLCLELKRQFYKDLEESEEIHFDKWRRRSWSSHILEWLGWKFRRWL